MATVRRPVRGERDLADMAASRHRARGQGAIWRNLLRPERLRKTLWQRDNAQLREKPEVIPGRPMFHDLAVPHPVDRDSRFGDVPARRGDPARQVPHMLAVRGESSHDLVALGDLILDLVTARSRRPEDLKTCFNPARPCPTPGKGGGLWSM